MKKTLIPFLLLPVLAASSAQAAIDLIAIGKLDYSNHDLSTRTASPLENGVAGNILGGMGSGLAYAGGNTFVAVPDRGPNAVAYNSTIDDTTSYINRFQTLNLSLTVNPSYDPLTVGSLPYTLSPFLTATTLLSSKAPLSYGVAGAPALNEADKFYFTGRSDNFNPAKSSTNPFNGRFDPEGIRVSNDGKSVFITDEYGPYVYQFNRVNGKRIKAFKLPDYYAVKTVKSFEKDTATELGEINSNTVGRTTNKGMEGLAITPDGTTLVGIMQTELRQDTKKHVRIITIDIVTGVTHEYAYKLTDGSGVSEIVAINDHEFLVDERDGKGLGDGNSAIVKRLFKIDIAAATDISGKTTIDTATTTLVTKTLFLDMVAKLGANGVTAANVPAKIEAVAFGPDMVIGGVNKHTLFIANDNDFVADIAGPNQFFVFTVDESDLLTFVPQTVAPFILDSNDRG